MSDNQNKIKLTNLGNLLIIGEDPKIEKQYLISLRAEIRKIEKDVSEPQNPFYLFKMEYLGTELIQCIGDKQIIKVQRGKTKSQCQRWAIYDYLQRIGQDANEENYQKEMDKIIAMINSWGI